eukprot:gene24124-biopygen9843
MTLDPAGAPESGWITSTCGVWTSELASLTTLSASWRAIDVVLSGRPQKAPIELRVEVHHRRWCTSTLNSIGVSWCSADLRNGY